MQLTKWQITPIYSNTVKIISKHHTYNRAGDHVTFVVIGLRVLNGGGHRIQVVFFLFLLFLIFVELIMLPMSYLPFFCVRRYIFQHCSFSTFHDYPAANFESRENLAKTRDRIYSKNYKIVFWGVANDFIYISRAVTSTHT